MPVYTYHCNHCNRDFDEMRTISERDQPIPCPECKNETSERKPVLCGFSTESGFRSSGSNSSCSSCSSGNCSSCH